VLTELLEGAAEILDGTTELLDGRAEPLSKTTELLDGTAELIDTTELSDGANELLGEATAGRLLDGPAETIEDWTPEAEGASDGVCEAWWHRRFKRAAGDASTATRSEETQKTRVAARIFPTETDNLWLA